MLGGAKKWMGLKFHLMGACWRVPCNFNLATLKAEFWNGVASILVWGNLVDCVTTWNIAQGQESKLIMRPSWDPATNQDSLWD